jgi:hypothetical protein
MVGKTGEVRTDPRFEDARGPNVRELRCIQRRLSQPEIEALVADYQAGGRVGGLAKVYGIHRTTVSAHVSPSGSARRASGDRRTGGQAAE